MSPEPERTAREYREIYDHRHGNTGCNPLVALALAGFLWVALWLIAGAITAFVQHCLWGTL